MDELIFLYGTLLSKKFNPVSELIKEFTQPVGAGWFKGKLYLIDDYPGAVPDKSPDSRVMGFIHKINDKQNIFSVLDEYEGYDPKDEDNSLFVRKQKLIVTNNGTQEKCWIYLYNKDIGGLTEIPDGNYLRYRKDVNDIAK